MNSDEIIDKLIELKDVWYATENVSGDVVWGECARDIDDLVEEAADGK